MAQIIHRSCFQTPDGSLFLTESDALRYQASLDSAEWYEHNKLYGYRAGSYVQFDELVDWLQSNWDMVKTLATLNPPHPAGHG